ncbi:calmodulin-like protein 3 [Herrania umbratica]|uniref:Calmodulin-like protein 3 n=1 Tax=Herrania umbratica TaxID=108875 RepID=A0A6J1ABV7_9ROSI|nr:calmodulin-like protein 3 [Herrania umbratica]
MFCSSTISKDIPPKCRRKTTPMLLTGTELKSIFKSFDSNLDGRLSKQELRKAFASLGSHIPSWRAGRGLHHADANRDGYISDDELDDLVEYALECAMKRKNEKQILQVFQGSDLNEDHLLNARELTRAFSQLDKPQLSSLRVNQALRKAIRNGDKSIDSNELPDLAKFTSSILR